MLDKIINRFINIGAIFATVIMSLLILECIGYTHFDEGTFGLVVLLAINLVLAFVLELYYHDYKDSGRFGRLEDD